MFIEFSFCWLNFTLCIVCIELTRREGREYVLVRSDTNQVRAEIGVGGCGVDGRQGRLSIDQSLRSWD